MHDHDSALLELRLPPDATAPTQARNALRLTLDRAISEDCADVVALLTTELVTNVIVHARTPSVLRVWVDDHLVRVGVTDFAPAPPTVRQYGADATTGRGMRLVEALSSRWGTTPDPSGKQVWFELSIPTEPSAVEPRFAFNVDDIDVL